MMCEGKFVFLAFAFLVLTAFASVCAAKTIYVPDDYLTIQSAVNATSTGDTIIVRDGLYKEQVIVNKQLTIKSERGHANCVVNGEGSDVFALYADGIKIEGFTITGGRHGIFINSNNNSILNNNISSNNEDGIYIPSSNNNIISNNIISNNDDGIFLWYSNNNCISDNIISNNNNGTYLYYSNNNNISNNNILNNYNPYYYGINAGIYLEYSNKTSILNNNISDNRYGEVVGGIFLWYSNKTSILNNNISNNVVGIYILYSNNSSISKNNISSNFGGVLGLYSSNNIIANNNISNNEGGIGILGSNNNSISKNNISSNNYGISLYESNDNIIYLNNFINNTCNAYSYDSTNICNSTEKITYTYRGSEFTNYMGNYWDDYTGSDADGDGIGDIPYGINADKDNYPLIEPFENYFMETPTPTPTPYPTPTPSPSPTPTPAKIFDTGRPDNPYPSISGKFIGTIKTNKKIIARKLYTYACEGTGGHTEYALIWNKTWCAEAKWKGYRGDWMNISFNKTVILMPYETYNITIVTGSYPQIHHIHSLKTENGWINCTEFTDANGKKYDDWIPAILLWS